MLCANDDPEVSFETASFSPPCWFQFSICMQVVASTGRVQVIIDWKLERIKLKKRDLKIVTEANDFILLLRLSEWWGRKFSSIVKRNCSTFCCAFYFTPLPCKLGGSSGNATSFCSFRMSEVLKAERWELFDRMRELGELFLTGLASFLSQDYVKIFWI